MAKGGCEEGGRGGWGKDEDGENDAGFEAKGIKKENLESKRDNYLGTRKESYRRPLSAIDQNKGDSVTSTADLSDSVFAEANWSLNIDVQTEM